MSGSGGEHSQPVDQSEEDKERERKLAKVTATVEWHIVHVGSIALFDALPPAAKDRELKKAADTFASTGRNVFVHYTIPILEHCQNLLLASGLTKKKYPKTVPQIGPMLDADETFFWHEAAREMLLCMKQGLLSQEDCLLHGGRLSEQDSYTWHAEVAVATYLGLPQPESFKAATTETVADGKESAATVAGHILGDELSDKLHSMTFDVSTVSETKRGGDSTITFDVNLEVGNTKADLTPKPSMQADDLLDTLPDRFEYEQNMLYSHFAHYDYDEVCKAEGKHQTAMLRQLADRFDTTGRILFYYYVVPRLCKQLHPPSKGDTVTS